MEPEKVGQFIKELRKKTNLTQKELADKFGVTYQAVSKWENGKSIPDVSILKEIGKEYGVSVDEILGGYKESNKPKNNNHKFLIIIIIILLGAQIWFATNNKSNSFQFKTISSTCSEFKVTGSLAYDRKKSSINISNINYCGGDDKTKYKSISCILYEKNGNTSTEIDACETSSKEMKLEEYLNDIEFYIDNYQQKCSKYGDESLYLEINAVDSNNKTTTYKIPLKVNENCKK